MAAAPNDAPPTLRCESPPADLASAPALGAVPDMLRCLSAASSSSHGSGSTDSTRLRESVGSDASALSRASSGSFQSQPAALGSLPRRFEGLAVNASSMPVNFRRSTGSFDTVTSGTGPSATTTAASRRRGYMRPQGTDFAASARSRESVLSLGSIAHLQYYFARTGLLDGKGGQLARKRQLKAHTLDLSSLDTGAYLTPKIANDRDSSYASLSSSPELATQPFGSQDVSIVESPTEEEQEEQQEEGPGWEDWEDPDPNMLPPTTSTYMHREKHVPKPPTIEELKDDLTNALKAAKRSLREARDYNKNRAAATDQQHKSEGPDTSSPASSPALTHGKKSSTTVGWYEIQGMHLLDVVTLAIRAAKIYYTAHDEPERLNSIKSERGLRSDLLTVMDVLRKMATRGFAGGMRLDEFDVMDGWISRVRDVLQAEEKIEAEEAAERKEWTWVDDAHPQWQQGGRQGEYAREEAFIRAMLAGSPDPIPGMEHVPAWKPMDRSQIPPAGAQLDSATAATRSGPPTPFLAALRDGLRLVQLHNCAVRRSRRRFGQISSFYTDT